jgi:hypothetical protein
VIIEKRMIEHSGERHRMDGDAAHLAPA